MDKEFDCRSPDALFKRYLADFEKIGIDWHQSDKEWTHKNLAYFAELGKGQGYSIWWKEEGGEYLVDLCWRGEPYFWTWMELALEEEWNPKWEEILFDFSKLMDVKAYSKVFICWSTEALRSELPSKLALKVSKHRIKFPEEAYLVMVFSRDSRRKPSERLQIEGFSIDFRGTLRPLAHKLFSDSVMTAKDGTGA